MVRQAAARMVEAGELGVIRMVQVEYVQGGNAPRNRTIRPVAEQSWRHNLVKGALAVVRATSARTRHNLLPFISGLR